MDHLPLPRGATIRHFPVPLLTCAFGDFEGFEDYPARHGWTLTLRSRVLEFQHDQQATSDQAQIGEFLQSWLYFGLLNAFGFTVDVAAFQAAAEHGTKRLTSACLSGLIPARLRSMRQAVQSMTESSLEEFAGHLQECLHITWTNLRWVVASASALLSPICLSIAALAESLESLLRSVLEETSISLTASVPWRIQPQYDFGLPLLAVMRQNGWCPYRLAHLDRDGNDSIGRLWYFANIQPPLHHEDHDGCSSEACRHLQIDPKTYSTAHSSRKCSCAFSGSNMHRLAEIVGAGGIPLVYLSNGFVQVIQASAKTNFVAISHVWADGMGNQTDNALPSCVLHQLQDRVNAVLCTDTKGSNAPFWIDTLCLPRHPIELRRKGIANLSESFKRASVVLVMDTYLCDVDTTALSPTETIARIAVSNWTMRLWTFSEGRLAKRVLFQFQDRAVEPLSLISGIEKHIDVSSGSPSDSIMIEILRTYNATTTTTAIDITTLSALRSALKTRSTSWPPDEALCLGYILGLDMAKLVEAKDTDKMQTYWSIMGPVPLGIAFSDTKTKIQARGCRWAPVSFTGNLEAEDWLGPPSLDNKFAVHSPTGLIVRLPTLFFSDENQGVSHLRARSRLIQRFRPPTELLGPLEFKHENGHWYHCIIEGMWHQAPPPSSLFEESRFAILLADPLRHNQQSPSLRGLLVTHRDETHDAVELPIPAAAHFHVSINVCTAIEDKYMEYLKSQAENVNVSHSAQIADVLDDREATFNMVWLVWVKKSAAYDEELLGLAKRVHQQRGMRDDTAALMIYCCDYVVWFLRVGEWYKIRQSQNTLEWCID